MNGGASWGAATGVTAIVAAMREEIAPLRARAKHVTALRGMAAGSAGEGLELVTGELGGLPVVLAVSGDGERNARQAMAALTRAVPIQRLIAIGVAGALSPELTAGDLVVCERVIRHGDASMAAADPALVHLVATGPRARRGVVVTADRIIDSPVEKERLLRATDHGAGVAVVDLESAAYVDAAGEIGIPWLVLRAVSDTAAEALPALLNRCRDEGGAVRRGKVALELIGDPGALPSLLSLRQRIRQCAETLADATEALLRSCADHRDRWPGARARPPRGRGSLMTTAPSGSLFDPPLGSVPDRGDAVLSAEDQPNVRAHHSPAAGAAADGDQRELSAVSHHRHVRGRHRAGRHATRIAALKAFVQMLHRPTTTHPCETDGRRLVARAPPGTRGLPGVAWRQRPRFCAGSATWTRRRASRCANVGNVARRGWSTSWTAPMGAGRCAFRPWPTCTTTASWSPASSARC